jgi:hypothetical protein
MVWDTQCAIVALVELARNQDALELAGIHAGLAHDRGSSASQSLADARSGCPHGLVV